MPIFLSGGGHCTVQDNNVCATVWLDQKNVMFMYTGFDPTSMGQVLRRQKDGTQGTFPCQVAGVTYNKHMGGVDLGDQHRGYYHVRMKCRKFYKYYIANFLFYVTITNSFTLYNLAHPHNKMVSLNFREVLAKQLIVDYCTRKRAGRGSHVVRPLPLLHFPIRLPTDSGPKRGRCALCKERKESRDSHWYCKECDIFLCHHGYQNDCFLAWHKNLS